MAGWTVCQSVHSLTIRIQSLEKQLSVVFKKAKDDIKSQPLYNSTQEKPEITAAYGDKEMMNCHVLMIENTNLFVKALNRSVQLTRR